MKLVDRILTVAIFAIAVVLMLGWVARTEWAAARDILGAGEGFSNALEPIIKITAAVLISVSGVHLLRDLIRRVHRKPGAAGLPPRTSGRSGESRGRQAA